MAEKQLGFQRFASPGEQRCIAREILGLYNAVLVGAVYTIPEIAGSVDKPETYLYPLKSCIHAHPALSVVVGDRNTDKPYYGKFPTINLSQHVHLVSIDKNTPSGDSAIIQKALAQELDVKFTDDIPQWRIIVVPLPKLSTVFVAFAFSHVLGDGPSGTAFHSTFLAALQRNKPADGTATAVTPLKELPPPFDIPERLPISWGFLIGPFIASILPSFIANIFGIHAAASKIDSGTWTGAYNSDYVNSLDTKVRVHEIEAPLHQKVSTAARIHDASLTAVLQQLIVRSMSKLITKPTVTNFIPQTVLNMRQAIGVPSDQMGNIASACYGAYPRIHSTGPFSDEDWETAKNVTREVEENEARLDDQAIGLLRYLMSIRTWMLSKLGARRECSFELSNVGEFDTESEEESGARIAQVVFSQTGPAVGVPINFNFAGVKNGSLTYTVTWQKGALDMPETQEETFVDAVCKMLREELELL